MITVEDIFTAAERDLGSRAFQHMGAGLLGYQWAMSSATFAEVWSAVRLPGQPFETPDPEQAMLLGLPILIDDAAEGLRIERY